MYQLNFIYQNKIITVPGGFLADACDQAGFPLDLVCNKKGTCGKCLVEIEVKGKKEKVLACQYPITHSMDVFLTDSQITHKAQVLTQSLTAHTVAFSPALTKTYLPIAKIRNDEVRSYLKDCRLSLLKKWATLILEPNCEGVTLVQVNHRVMDVNNGDTTNHLYGAAVDIGTTTVALYLYDLNNGELLHTASALNRQITHGGDVIARILACQEDPQALTALQTCILSTIDALLADCYSHFSHAAQALYQLVVCGNSTMAHLFFGLNPKSLGAFPYTNVTTDRIETHNAHLGLNLPEFATIQFLPLLGGFVGADTTSVLLTLPQDTRHYLVIDLGTNGELAVGNTQGFYTASTACGPALEGANIACGMRASAGAIEKIEITDQDITLQVIGGGTPKGLCGSAIIDAVAELLRVGVINPSGYLLSREEYLDAFPQNPLAQHLGVVDDNESVFFFTQGPHPVYLSQQDVRQIQLAKSSIYSGCLTILKECSLDLDAIDTVILAGAFGNYIDIANALAIGLLPKVPPQKITSIGNGAGLGVQLCLLNQKEYQRAMDIKAHTQQIKLADNPDFMDEYIMNMNF